MPHQSSKRKKLTDGTKHEWAKHRWRTMHTLCAKYTNPKVNISEAMSSNSSWCVCVTLLIFPNSCYFILVLQVASVTPIFNYNDRCGDSTYSMKRLPRWTIWWLNGNRLYAPLFSRSLSFACEITHEVNIVDRNICHETHANQTVCAVSISFFLLLQIYIISNKCQGYYETTKTEQNARLYCYCCIVAWMSKHQIELNICKTFWN